MMTIARPDLAGTPGVLCQRVPHMNPATKTALRADAAFLRLQEAESTWPSTYGFSRPNALDPRAFPIQGQTSVAPGPEQVGAFLRPTHERVHRRASQHRLHTELYGTAPYTFVGRGILNHVDASTQLRTRNASADRTRRMEEQGRWWAAATQSMWSLWRRASTPVRRSLPADVAAQRRPCPAVAAAAPSPAALPPFDTCPSRRGCFPLQMTSRWWEIPPWRRCLSGAPTARPSRHVALSEPEAVHAGSTCREPGSPPTLMPCRRRARWAAARATTGSAGPSGCAMQSPETSCRWGGASAPWHEPLFAPMFALPSCTPETHEPPPVPCRSTSWISSRGPTPARAAAPMAGPAPPGGER